MALSGGGAGLPLAELCDDAIACMFRSGCVSFFDPVPYCYCGVDDMGVPKECLDGTEPATGPCKKELEWAAETADAAAIADRFANTSYAIGRAGLLLDCYSTNSCGKPCFMAP
jgi:hypothetical protein